jgi:SAM-dependent methyltransferase
VKVYLSIESARYFSVSTTSSEHGTYNRTSMERMLEATWRAEDGHFWFRGLRRTARQFIEAARGRHELRRIVDCGAGTGRNLDWLREYGDAVGVELSATGLAAGRVRGRRLVAGSVAALPFADSSVDLATSFDVLYCLDDATERKALSEMYRILRPGGFAIVNAAALDVLRGSHSTLTHEVRRYTPERLRRRLLDAGFTVERLTFTNFTPFPVALVLRGIERLSGRAGEASDHDLRVPAWPINAFFNATLRAEAAVLRVVNLPVGTSVMAVGRKKHVGTAGRLLYDRGSISLDY